MNEQKYMKQALNLAKKGRGKVSPNPLVGAVLVKNSRVVGVGYHERYGEAHAEVNAIRDAGDKSAGSVLYCNLEPCSHWGNTPPCTEAIIRAGIKKVVIGMKDPNPAINGEGIKNLRSNNINVTTGILEHECVTLNEFYRKFILTGKPFVTVKMAQTLDGKIALSKNSRYKITSEKAQKYVHKLRTEYDAVLVGRKTALIDNPRLNPRLAQGKDPAKVLLDTNLKCKPSLAMFSPSEPGQKYIATVVKDSEKIRLFEEKGIEVIGIGANKFGMISLDDLMVELGKRNITSVLVEGGAETFAGFVREKQIDRIVIFIAPFIFGKGVNVIESFSSNGSIVLLKDVSTMNLGVDQLITGIPVFA